MINNKLRKKIIEVPVQHFYRKAPKALMRIRRLAEKHFRNGIIIAREKREKNANSILHPMFSAAYPYYAFTIV